MTDVGGCGRLRIGLGVVGCLLLGLSVVPRLLGAEVAGSDLVYVANYSEDASHGIYAYRFQGATGKLTALGRVADVVSPSFLATDPQHRVLYVATDKDQDPKELGFISSYSIDKKTGGLTLLNRVDLDGGPCHLSVDSKSKILFVANYNKGSVVSYALERNGRIGKRTGFDQHLGSGPDRARQDGPHAHAVVLSPDNRFLFVPNLGTDQIKIYKVDEAKRTFLANDPAFATVKPGLGPRHMVFGADGKFAYVICEMGSSVVALSYDAASGSLKPVQTISTLPHGFTGIDNSAEIGIDRAGRFLYASNRGHDSITVFSIDPQQGLLNKVQVAPSLGEIPRNFAIDPSGKYLLAGDQLSDQLVLFAVDGTTGELKATGTVVKIAKPVCILFVPEGSSL